MKQTGDTSELPTLRVHSILYGNEIERIKQAIEHLNRAADFCIAQRVFSKISLVYGDCSPSPVLDPEFVRSIEESCQAIDGFRHVYFNENLGSAQGHNRLLKDFEEDYVLIMNPDIMLAPNTLVELAKAYGSKGVGMVEARQLPIEHPKEYDPKTGETSWAATACALIPGEVIKELNGFDSDTFFLYCDDVDFSWRVRLSGKKVIYRASAVVYHDKRLGAKGAWVPGEAEKYYSAEAALLLAHKYSREDIVRRIIGFFRNSPEPHFQKAVESYESRENSGTLPQPIDLDHKVGVFVNDAYAKHRFSM
ncbi:glycosyltransferase family 2 protein [Pseudoxanthomonas koreensis]|uniref:glycosyltransferase family 2 protein n=1 Tax=Pseudoxanthomonas koreensis TaxID=266061 RepID=UPI00192EF482|nr:glycosyltransferase family 2 protein [Pseudoxanthomonas koreensis]KAF1691584.1 glycosyl transferase [Pseudoxanthomonas koreensis]